MRPILRSTGGAVRLVNTVASGAAVAALACASNGTAPKLAGRAFAQVAAGYIHTCAVTTAGLPYCWGDNEAGQLGAGSLSLCSDTPTAVVGALKLTAVVAGYMHSCGLRPDGAAYCWGDNELGLLGAGEADTAFHPTPTPVSGGIAFRVLSAGGYLSGGDAFDAGHTCGLTSSGTAYCWGSNVYGELGAGTRDTLAHPGPEPVVGGLTFQAISAGGGTTCGLTAAGAAYCWGVGSVAGDTAPSTTPAPVAGGMIFRQVAAGTGYGCGLDISGAALCWGFNGRGSLGDGDSVADRAPHGAATVVGGLTFKLLTAGSRHACGITAAGAAYCWGDDSSGQLGTSSLTGYCYGVPGYPGIPTRCGTVPMPVAGGLSFSSIGAGVVHSCGVASSGVTYCWGRNEFGQLGDGSKTSRAAPVPVAGQL